MERTRLKELRIGAGLAVSQLAKKAGVSAQTIYSLEAGKNKRIQLKTLGRLAKALEVRDEELFQRSEAPPPSRELIPALATWSLVLTCPKCRSRFRITVLEGAPDPGDMGIGCPICGFTQTISLRRGA